MDGGARCSGEWAGSTPGWDLGGSILILPSVSISKTWPPAPTYSGMRGWRDRTRNTSVSSGRLLRTWVWYPAAGDAAFGMLAGIDSRTVLCICRLVTMVVASRSEEHTSELQS